MACRIGRESPRRSGGTQISHTFVSPCAETGSCSKTVASILAQAPSTQCAQASRGRLRSSGPRAGQPSHGYKPNRPSILHHPMLRPQLHGTPPKSDLPASGLGSGRVLALLPQSPPPCKAPDIPRRIGGVCPIQSAHPLASPYESGPTSSFLLHLNSRFRNILGGFGHAAYAFTRPAQVVASQRSNSWRANSHCA